MSADNTLPINTWREVFELFPQVERVDVDTSSGRLDIFIRGCENNLKATAEELNDLIHKFSDNPHEVIASFLKKQRILDSSVAYQNTLVGFFDIQAYSAFIKINKFEEAVQKINKLFRVIRNLYANFGKLKIDVQILSDSVILVLDTNRSPLLPDTIKWFLATCSEVMRLSMELHFPLRGAIGGGYFYKDGEIIVSSGLLDAHDYEIKQDWLGAVLTPAALKLVEEKNDLLSKDITEFVRYGYVPWKQDRSILKPVLQRVVKCVGLKTYYIKPRMAYKDWENYLPDYFNDPMKVKNSQCLYAQD